MLCRDGVRDRHIELVFAYVENFSKAIATYIPLGVYFATIPDRFRDVDPNQYLCEFLQTIHLPCKGVWGYAGPNNPVLGWT